MGKEDKDKKKSHKSDSKEDSKKSHKSDKKSKHREEKERKHSKGDHERGKDDGDDRPKITVDDYFTKSEEFRVWLKLTKGSYFEDLTSKDARKIFEKDFVKDFNKGRLSAMFYDGNIPHDIRAATVKSQHKWGIKMSKQETEQLADLAEDVDMQTRAPTATTDATKQQRGPQLEPPKSSSSQRGPDRPSLSHKEQQKSHSRAVMDELPRAGSSFEARADKRRTAGDTLHGAHRQKEEDRDGLEQHEGTALGGDSKDDFQSMVERDRKRSDKKRANVTERARELEEKQRERDTAFMQKIGFDPSQGRMRIAPRED